MISFDGSLLIEDFNKVISLIYGDTKPFIKDIIDLDTVFILRNMVVTRLNKDEFDLNTPKVIKVINVTPPFDIVVVKLKVNKETILTGVERMSM